MLDSTHAGALRDLFLLVREIAEMDKTRTETGPTLRDVYGEMLA